MPLIINEPLKIERIAIAIANLPQFLSGKKIVQFSDLHYDGVRLSEHLLSEAIARCNTEKPDLILLTGDFVTDDPSPIVALASRLKLLNATTGLYACLGNHDYARRDPKIKQQVIEALTAVNIQVLWNEIAYPWGQELALVGLADLWSGEFQPSAVFDQISPEIPRIVLSHNPDSAETLKQWRVDLQLSGHTHGGQVVIPGYGAVPILLQQIRKNTPQFISKRLPFLRKCYRVVRYWQWSEGWHQVGRNQLYINRGLGTYFPGRLFCPPEMTVITLESR